jgi:hypothetical protein
MTALILTLGCACRKLESFRGSVSPNRSHRRAEWQTAGGTGQAATEEEVR